MAKKKRRVDELPQFSSDDTQRLLDQLAASQPNLEQLFRDSESQLEKLLAEDSVLKLDPSLFDLDLEALLKEDEDSQARLMESIQQLSVNWDSLFEGLSDDSLGEPEVTPDPNLTAEDAAEWMKAEVENRQVLPHAKVIYHLARHFGTKFTRRNKAGNRVIAIEVLEAFLKITKDDVVWSRRDQLWRKRRASDIRGKRMVE